MPINVSEALDIHTSEKILVERYSAGTRSGGLFVPGSSSIFKALASVQQPTHKILMVLAEGERTQNPRLFVCNKLLRCSDEKLQTLADIIIWDGKRFKIIKLGNWFNYGHSQAIGIEE